MSDTNKMNRRNFIRAGVAGVTGLSLAQTGWSKVLRYLPEDLLVDEVRLGNTGLTVPRVALGTGTKGWNHASNLTRRGMDHFLSLSRHAYERGIRFFDMADMYGTHPFVGRALKEIPRDKVVLLTKMMTYDEGSEQREPVRRTLERFLKETGTDYFDILLMHCMNDGKWPTSRAYYMEGLERAKEEGLVRAVGVSCHDYDALLEASVHPWCDVILARLNPFRTLMDGTTESVNELLGRARSYGKGVIGMKIFGEGRNTSDEEREHSIRYAVTESNLHCMTLGLETIPQMDDAIERVMRNAREARKA